jgi:propionate catabolism operon transcriptional regulator
MGKIGIIWSAKILNKSASMLQNCIVYDNVKMSSAMEYVEKLLSEKVDIIVATAGIYFTIRDKLPIPMVVGYSDYIDILESLREYDQDGIRNKKIALVIHKSHAYDLNKLRQYTISNLDLAYFQDRSEIPEIIENLSMEGYFGIVSGPTAGTIAQSIGLRYVPIGINDSIIDYSIRKAQEILDINREQRLLVQKLESIIDDLPQGLLISTSGGIIQDSNQLARQMLKLPAGELKGKNIFDLIPGFAFDSNNPIEFVNVLGSNYYISTKGVEVADNYLYAVYFTHVDQLEELQFSHKKAIDLGLVAKYHFSDIIYESAEMKETIERAKAFSQYDYTVLIEGETGTGKEMIAQSIHNESIRRRGPFVAINCASLPENLLESELMGYDSGAFTGASKEGKPGLFEQANHGTIFLDEIHQMSLRLQANLLRVLQEQRVKRIGSNRILKVDVRVILATNEKIHKKVEEGSFRSDLYYRIAVLQLVVPSLRRRQEDIETLTRYFLKKYESTYGKITSKEANYIIMNTLQKEWPGNVRELENYVYSSAVLLQNQLNPEMSRTERDKTEQWITLKLGSIREMEKTLIEKTLIQFGGNITKTAEFLGITRATLTKKLKN